MQLIFLLLLLGISCYLLTLNEPFQNYTINPYGYVSTGNNPLYFYNLDRYRKPYRWPFRFYQSYPYGHMSPLN